MKYLYAGFVLLLVSCATRPAVPPVIEEAVITQSVSELPPVLASVFERALRNVTENSPLVTKYLEPGPVRNGADISVKGECLIDGRQFQVSYDVPNAEPDSDNNYRIAFSMRDVSTGVTHNDELFWTPGEDRAGLLLSFDDDYLRNWSHYFNLFDNYDARVTFFVQGLLAVTGRADISLHHFCEEALSRGHGLGFHSVSHIDLTKISRVVFNRETIDAAAAFQEAGIPFSAFAFPYGFSEPWMKGVLEAAFPFTRGFGANIRFYTAETLSDGYLISKSIDNILYPDDAVYERDVRLILLSAKFVGNTVVPFTTHDIAEDAQWGIKPRRLEYLLKTARDLRLQFYTYESLSSASLLRIY